MNDATIRKLYIEFDIPCDVLVRTPHLLGAFTESYNQETGQEVDVATMGTYVQNLRRKGQANGGLPRIRRGPTG
jgi:hypothetical protein